MEYLPLGEEAYTPFNIKENDMFMHQARLCFYDNRDSIHVVG